MKSVDIILTIIHTVTAHLSVNEYSYLFLSPGNIFNGEELIHDTLIHMYVFLSFQLPTVCLSTFNCFYIEYRFQNAEYISGWVSGIIVSLPSIHFYPFHTKIE